MHTWVMLQRRRVTATAQVHWRRFRPTSLDVGVPVPDPFYKHCRDVPLVILLATRLPPLIVCYTTNEFASEDPYSQYQRRYNVVSGLMRCADLLIIGVYLWTSRLANVWYWFVADNLHWLFRFIFPYRDSYPTSELL
jgi:hypothetical protein